MTFFLTAFIAEIKKKTEKKNWESYFELQYLVFYNITVALLASSIVNSFVDLWLKQFDVGSITIKNKIIAFFWYSEWTFSISKGN